MNLPERLYYPLDKAAKELGCDISDIIHYGANGFVNVCIKVYSSGKGFRSGNDDWSPNLLVNYDSINGIVSKEDVTYEEDELGGKLVCYSQEFNFINSYLKLSGRVDFWLEDESLQVVDSSAVAYGVYGLVEVSERELYVNEMNLINNESIMVSSFTLPCDATNKNINGYFRLPGDCVYNDELISKDNNALRENGIENSLSHESGVLVNINDLLITKDELNRLNGKLSEESVININPINEDNPKSLAKKAEIIPALIRLLPDFKSADIDMMPVSKIKNVIESLAATNGVDLPDTHIQTWQKYLGRNRPRK